MPSAMKNRRQKMGGGGGNAKRRNKRIKHQRRAEVVTPAIKAAWDKSKTFQENMKAMGIATDANKVVPFKPHRFMPETIEVADLKQAKQEKEATTIGVVQDLEMEAAQPEKEKKFQLSQVQVDFCTKMLNLYGEDYKAMSRDRILNLDQLTASQMRMKIRAFKRSKQQYKRFLDDRKLIQEQLPMDQQ